MVVGSARRVARTPEDLAAARAIKLDLPRWQAMLIDAGSELLPMLHTLVGECPSDEERERIARAMWPLLRQGWSGWWRLFRIWDAPDAWAEWQRCMGSWDLWRRANLEGLVKYWMERAEEPYKIMPIEVHQVNRWLYGLPYQWKDRPETPPPFWVEEMLNPEQPF